MLIKRLVIKESYPNEKVIRDCKFNLEGLNLIVDKGSTQRGNGVGKTTFLRLIDLAFGAKNKKAIYQDPETNSTNYTLKEYIENNKVFIELTIITDTEEVVLKVELFTHGNRSINGEILNYNAYNEKLNKIVFNNENGPSFRNLIGKFIRVKMNGDSNGFLHFNDDHCTISQYQNIYNYLFKFKNIDIENSILSLRENIKNLENQFKTIKQTLKYENLSEIDAKIDIISFKVNELEAKQKTYIDEKIVLDEQKILENRKIYALLNRECEKLNFDIKVIEENIKKENANNDEIDIESLNEFYDDVKFNIKDLNRKFEELVKFNKQLCSNQLNTYNKLLKKKQEKLTELNIKKDEFYKNNKEYMFLVESGNLDEYLSLQESLNNYQTGLGECYNAKDIYSEYNLKIEKNNEKLSELIEINKDNNVEKNIKLFNSIFTKYSKNTINSEYFLYYNEDGFPFSISNVDGSFSTGTRKSAIIAFDLAYLEYANILKIDCPSFVVHDVLENIHQKDFNQTINLIKKNKYQYIAAILKQNVNLQDNINENDIILTLSDDEKLFKI